MTTHTSAGSTTVTTTMTAGDATTAAAATQPGRTRRVLGTLAGSLVCLLVLPVVVLFGAPVSAWALGTGLVLANALAHAAIAWSVRDASNTVVLGAMGFSFIIRAGLTALVLLLVGVKISGAPGDRAIGLDQPELARVAIIVFLIGFTVDAAIDTVRRAAQRTEYTPAPEISA